jgi:protein-S-isoprenylcysteine O-methyltransferase Ste14
MGRAFLLLYGAVAYLAFLGSFLYTIGFVGCVGVRKCVDTGHSGAVGTAILIDTALLLAFAVQHSVMARRWFKAWWTRIVPRSAERSTYVLIASALVALLLWQWRPIAGGVWYVGPGVARDLLWLLFTLAWFVILSGSFMIDHFDLFGLRQVWTHFRGREYQHPPLQTGAYYRYTRNPLMLGFIVAFWATPTMSLGHLYFAIAATAYIVLGIVLEERDHAFYLGDAYRRYRARTPMLIPFLRGGGRPQPSGARVEDAR